MADKEKDIGTKVRDWLASRSRGNPLIPSKEKEQIELLDEDERKAKEAADRAQQDTIDQYEKRRE